jgi:hypothetical protein
VEPYSCTGGEYWREGEGKFECPKCGEINRLLDRHITDKLPDRSDVIKLKYNFKEIVKT